VEAPSDCIGAFSCQALPLANFGSVTFDSATAASTTGPSGTIRDGRWGRTKIRLTAGNQRLIVTRGSIDAAGTAAPSVLRGGGSAFDVTYASASVQRVQGFARDSRVRAGYVQH